MFASVAAEVTLDQLKPSKGLNEAQRVVPFGFGAASRSASNRNCVVIGSSRCRRIQCHCVRMLGLLSKSL